VSSDLSAVRSLTAKINFREYERSIETLHARLEQTEREKEKEKERAKDFSKKALFAVGTNPHFPDMNNQ